MRSSSMATLVLAALVGGVGCSRLTSPPSPDPIASDTPVTMATAKEAPHPPGTPSARLRARERPDEGARGAEGQGDLKIVDLNVGKGPAVKAGDVVVVHYTGMLINGTKFDSSYDHPGKQPLTTRIPGNLIQGWNKGIPGMRVGGKRRLIIPPSLGYGARPRPGIPPNSTLVFEISLLEIKSNPHPPPPPKAP
jgi:FKBP-type peptidyl-prolyl cis-trans isomerase